MNNEEPIELAHFPGAKPPKPDEKPKIERDDFPAPPYPYTDPGIFSLINQITPTFETFKSQLLETRNSYIFLF